MKVYHNDKWIEETQAMISINNPGFTTARTVYETVRTYGGKLFKFQRHFERLQNSAQAMGIQTQKTCDQLIDIIEKGIALNELKEAYVQIYLTKNPDLIVQIKELPQINPQIYTKGISTDISRIRRHAYMHNGNAIKTTAAFDVFMARIQKPIHLYDMIMLNDQGYVAEGTFSNIFIVKTGILITPAMETGILSGITREVVIALAKKNHIGFQERLVAQKELFEADELFLTHTSTGIAPISELAGITCPVGPLTSKLIKVLNSFTGNL